MKSYVAVVATIQPVRVRNVETTELGQFQDATGALARFFDESRGKLNRFRTETIIVCPLEEENAALAFLAKK